MLKTVICHFYNEEHLLPWWLKHHRNIFDNGIMIDYNSTDRSVEIIRELCPTWDLVSSRNAEFDAGKADREVQDWEGILGGWRANLNVTEFLYGNYDRLDDDPTERNIFIGNYVFTDMEDASKGPIELDHDIPLHKQRYWGYKESGDPFVRCPGGTCRRMNRSIHNYQMDYSHHSGRHFPQSKETFDDLFIFYYGYADASEAGLARKTQIQDRMSEFDKVRNSGGHVGDKGTFVNRIRVDHQPRSSDIRSKIEYILEHNRRITGQDW